MNFYRNIEDQEKKNPKRQKIVEGQEEEEEKELINIEEEKYPEIELKNEDFSKLFFS